MNLKAVLIAGLVVPAIPFPALAVCVDGKTASWYGEPHLLPKRPAEIGCASRDHKKGTKLRVTDLDTRRSVVCTVDDWGPAKWTGCELDLPPGPASRLDMLARGTIRATVAVVGVPWALEHRWPETTGKKAAGNAPTAKAERRRARSGKRKGRR